MTIRMLLAYGDAPDRVADLRRAGLALALSAVFGAALGARFGPLSMLVHALGVPVGVGAVLVLGVPACGIALAHAGARVELGELLSAMGRAAASVGIVLAGLAPATALVVVSAESVVTGSVFGAMVLALAGSLGACRFAIELRRIVSARSVPILFFLFAAALSARVWTSVLPMLGGAP